MMFIRGSSEVIFFIFELGAIKRHALILIYPKYDFNLQIDEISHETPFNNHINVAVQPQWRPEYDSYWRWL